MRLLKGVLFRLVKLPSKLLKFAYIVILYRGGGGWPMPAPRRFISLRVCEKLLHCSNLLEDHAEKCGQISRSMLLHCSNLVIDSIR